MFVAINVFIYLKSGTEKGAEPAQNLLLQPPWAPALPSGCQATSLKELHGFMDLNSRLSGAAYSREFQIHQNKI